MRHPSDGDLRTYLDEAMLPGDAERVREHVAHCKRCSARLVQIEVRAARVRSLVDPLIASETDSVSRAVSPQVARRRLEAYERSNEEEVRMGILKRMFARRYSPAWVALVVVAVLGLSLMLAPVRAFAGEVLGLFRVQKIEVVEFDPSTLFDEQGVEAAMQSLERFMDEQVTVDVEGEAQEVDEATLRSLSSMRVRLPQKLSDTATYKLQPGGTASVKVDHARIQTLLAELGYDKLDLPQGLDGANIEVQLAPVAVAAYGDCEPGPGREEIPDAEAPGSCMVLTQMRSPAVLAPDGLDVQQLGQVYLQLLGMSVSEAERFGARVDWTATLVVPIPGSEAEYEDVTVDGVPGVLIRPTENRVPQSEYLMMWVKDDIVYTLIGEGSRIEAVQVGNSLQ